MPTKKQRIKKVSHQSVARDLLKVSILGVESLLPFRVWLFWGCKNIYSERAQNVTKSLKFFFGTYINEYIISNF